MQSTLVAALVSCADHHRRDVARRFVQGLSVEEMKYIAEFLGACILDSHMPEAVSGAQLAAKVETFHRLRSRRGAGTDHHAILLLEFLRRCGVRAVAAARGGFSAAVGRS